MSNINDMPAEKATNNVETDMAELKKLQQRLNHESIKYQFRTKLVGGLHEEDVTRYIEDLENKLKKFEQDNKKISDDLYSLKTKLNTELEHKNNMQIELDEAKQNLITAIVEFKQKQMDYKSMNEKYSAENIQLKNEIQQITGRLKELEKLSTETNYDKEYLADLEIENNSLKAKIAEMTEEFMQYNEIKNKNKLMAEEIAAYEELLNQTSIELDQMEVNTNKLKNENILLKERITELEKSILEKDYKINEINDVCEKLKEQLRMEKSCNEKLNSDSVILRQKISSLQQTINEKLKELEEQKRISEDAVLQLNMEKAEAFNYKINGFKEEFSSIYEKMEKLEYEAKQSAKLNGILKQQLSAQHSRAEKAEEDLAKIVRLLSEVGDKFYNKRDILGDEFIQLIEKQISKQPEKNGKIINL
ncbi:MAG: hypothetical protein GYA02_08265 [Clostridiaceae bacterium]|nr:hypothetical protein [Clostridiaceae bacterium]